MDRHDELEQLLDGFHGYLREKKHSLPRATEYTIMAQEFSFYLHRHKGITWQDEVENLQLVNDFLNIENINISEERRRVKREAVQLFQEYCRIRTPSRRILELTERLERWPTMAVIGRFIAAAAAISGLIAFAIYGFQAYQVVNPPSPTPTPTASPFPSLTPVPTQTPTNTPTITPTPNATQLFLTTHVPTLNAVFEPVIRTVRGIEQAWVPAGAFTMGDHFDDGKGYDDELVHSVYTKEFWIDRFLVTTQQFSECPVNLCGNPAKLISHKRPEGYYGVDAFDDYPVIEVIWDQASAYCAWRGGRLPTEAEWEKAAGWDPATGETRLYPWGDEPPNNAELASFDRVDLDTSRVDMYPAGASPVGAFDMAGNVWQLTADWYGPYLPEIFFNPTGATTGQYRVVRGGSWSEKDIIHLRVANRGKHNPANAGNEIGFRCIYDVKSDD